MKPPKYMEALKSFIEPVTNELELIRVIIKDVPEANRTSLLSYLLLDEYRKQDEPTHDSRTLQAHD